MVTASLGDEALQPCVWDNQSIQMQLALVSGHRWLTILEIGKARDLAEVAREADHAYVSRMVNLTTLVPDIVAVILDESLPD